MVQIVIDSESGFCFGVVKAISKAEQELAKSGELYCLGDIVHNGQEVNRLSEKGLKTIDHKDLNTIHNATVLLRAHGEPPSTYHLAKKNQINIIDASCPVVLMLQKKILTAHKQYPDAQIVIYGKKGHAEVNGLVGQTHGNAIVVQDESELDQVDFNRDIVLFSQTTKSVKGFNSLVTTIEEHRNKACLFLYYDTICRQVANRLPNIRAFATQYDLILFVSGAKSSNGKVLFAECLSVNENSHMVSSLNDIHPEWLEGVNSVGICGATSTPKWLMEEVAKQVKEITEH